VNDYTEMAHAIEAADALVPIELRRAAEERFSRDRMVADHVAAYERACASS
jgi:hypothetical protein